VERFRFGPARRGEVAIYGAQRPGYDSRSVDKATIHEWIEFVRGRRIQRICCLLPPTQLAYYRVDLLAEYKAVFGESNVLHAPIEDFRLCEADVLERQVLPFLADSATRKLPVVVHCSGGSGRTGHVLAAWLVRHGGLDVDTALVEVRSSGRNPKEAVDCGNATLDQLRTLLTGAAYGNPARLEH
jgi:protein-tyrosine phosphatase